MSLFFNSKKSKLINILIIAIITVSFFTLLNCSGGGGGGGTSSLSGGASVGTPGIIVDFIAPLTTTESGGETTFQVALNSEPSDDVIIDLSSSDMSEGTISTGSLTFTPLNWNAPQIVTITGVEDAIQDGSQAYSIITQPAISDDSDYDSRDGDDVPVSNTDNDTAGITVSAISGDTTEAGAQATFTVALNSEPVFDVTIDLSSSDTAEGTVSPASLTFTPLDWNAPQTVTATGIDDAIQDGNLVYSIVTAAATSTDGNYAGIDPANVFITNIDNDSAGITVSAVSGNTTEAGGQATFTIVLNSEPADDVSVDLSSSDTGEGTISPASLTFTSLNWNAPQTVTATGVDDAIQDGNQPYFIITDQAFSPDLNYAGIDPDNASVTNTDNDSAGITVGAISGDTTEAGVQATFTIVLNSEPTNDVSIDLSSSDTNEGTVSPASLTFTSANWNAPQTVTVTGVNDFIQDGNQVYSIITDAAGSIDGNYNGIDPENVSVTNTDNDSAGITVSAISGNTTEAGVQATFTIVLNSEPTNDVSIDLSSSDTNEGTVSPASLTFTSANWNAPQTVTVTGVNDFIQDGNQVYSIITDAAASSDTNYDTIDPVDVSVTNTDNDSAGITVSAISGDTTEAGVQATFTIVLNSRPLSDVSVDLSSSDTNEGTVSPASLTFTSANWNAPQTVTVTGVDDFIQDGNQVYSIITDAASSSDTNYDTMDPDDVSVTNTDNDSAGITVSTISGDTTEAGVQATFTIVLNSEPTVNVSIDLSSSNTNEGTVSPASLTFTSANWNAPQTVTITGVDDFIQDGNQVYTIATSAAVSTDFNYNGMDPDNVTITNIDNDSAGITVSAISGDTTEAGGQSTFTIVLNSEPTGDVSVDLTSIDLSEGNVSPASLTFTPANWNAPQTVTVTGVDDYTQDGNQVYTITTSAATSVDSNYNGIDPDNMSVTNTDNDSAGITVSAISGNTTEAGVQATFTIVLNSEPFFDVSIDLSSSDTNEGTVSPASLTFTSANWNAPQTVTITGVNDFIQDGNQVYSIITDAAASSDTNYDTMDPDDVSVTNTDNDSAGITVGAISGNTTEAGVQATFTVVLNSEPFFDVSIDLSSSDTNEGTVSPASLTFTSANWNAPQTVTVTGADDFIQDGNQVYSIITDAAVSIDFNYNGMDPNNVTVTNTDNDSAGISVGVISGNTTEGGGQATFAVVLNSEPLFDVSIDLSSSDTGEGTVSPTSLTFTSANWNAPQTVTATGVDDGMLDGNQPYTIITSASVSSDPNYSGIDPSDPSLTNEDNDNFVGINVSAISGDTTEAGGQATFTIVLNSQPADDVTIDISSSDTDEGTVSTSSITFTSVNWDSPQTVTVTGVDDILVDGNQPYFVITDPAFSFDANYSGLDAANVSVTNSDDDMPGITISEVSGDTSEAGGIATFSIVLNSPPSDDLTIGLSSSDETEGTIDLSSLTFTSANWNAHQTVTITGVDDAILDGHQPYFIITDPADSFDMDYDGLDSMNVSLRNTDNDSEGITVSEISGNTTEGGGKATFTIVLNSQPSANVTIDLSSNDTSEGTINPSSVTFTSTDWASPKLITITGVDDAVPDGNQPYSIMTNAASSFDPGYDGLDPDNVSLINVDNDSAAITVTPDSGLITTEQGGEANFTVELNSAPTGDVTVTLSSSDTSEGTISPSSITFTTTNWASQQTITITGADDALQDGNQLYSIVLDPATSSDFSYDGLDPIDVTVTNNDNETAGFTISPATNWSNRLTTSEGGIEASFSIVLNSAPSADVYLTLTVSDATEASINKTSLIFTINNWNAPQTVVVTGLDDADADGNRNYTVNTNPSVSTDPDYNAINPGNIYLQNIDNEQAGVTFDPVTSEGLFGLLDKALITTEGGGQVTYTMVLNSPPAGDVDIDLTSNDTSEGAVSPASLTFTTVNWNIEQTVTVTGADDLDIDGNQDYEITAVSSSSDPDYDNLSIADVYLLNTDDDTAGFLINPETAWLFRTLSTSESSDQDTFTVVLTKAPTADVTLTLYSNDAGEGLPSPATLLFTTFNWDAPQTVTVTGVDDGTADGDQYYDIRFNAAESLDPDYDGLTPVRVYFTNVDNE